MIFTHLGSVVYRCLPVGSWVVDCPDREKIPGLHGQQRGRRERSLFGMICSLESHQPQLASIGHFAGLLPPGWLRSDIPGSHHLLALNSDKGGALRCREEEARGGKAQTAFLKAGGHIWLLSRALGSPGGGDEDGRREGSGER